MRLVGFVPISLKNSDCMAANADFDVCEGDIRASDRLHRAFGEFRPKALIHFAGLKAVGESNEKPLGYYSQNVTGSIELLNAMRHHDCRRIMFSSDVRNKWRQSSITNLSPGDPTETHTALPLLLSVRQRLLDGPSKRPFPSCD